MEMLWPECDPVLGRNSLSQSLSSLRHQLEPPGVSVGEVLRADRYIVQLIPDAISTDVSRFEAIRRDFHDATTEPERSVAFAALDRLYRGEFMPGYYEDWNLRERDRIQRMFFDALVSRIEQLESQDDLASAIACGHRSVEIDPLNEQAHLRLIRLHAANGDNARALRQYGVLHKSLADELGVAPSAEAGELARKLQAGIATKIKTSEPQQPKPERSKPDDRPLPLSGIWAVLVIDVEPDSADSLNKLVARHGGEKIKKVTSFVTVLFGRASDALDCAIGFQVAADKKPNAARRAAPRMALHVGELGKGETSQTGVRVITEHAEALINSGHAGQLLCSEAIATMLLNSPDPNARFQDLGSYRLKGDERSERVYQADHERRAGREFPPLNAEAGHESSLPRHLSRFFGRESEIAALRNLLDPSNTDSRLVTITGPGGTGKTRLSVETARSLESNYRNAVWFVPLAAIKEPDHLPGAILEAMQMQPGVTADPLKHLITILSRETPLLVLDNFEHWLSDTSPQQSDKSRELVRTMLEHVPTLHCLVTSRRRLGLIGETEFYLQPLPTPEEQQSLEDMSVCESVQLFVDRSQSVRPSFQITNSNSEIVADICRRLEGIPLALELAAAKSQVLTQSQILEGLSHRLDFLSDRRRQTEARHQKLRVTIDWSFQMLAPEARDFFASLSVFRGGANLADIEAICDEPLALDYLALLQDFSFLTIEENSLAGDMRFRLLEMLREYGEDKLPTTKRTDMEARHARHYAQVAELAHEMLKTSAQSEWLQRMEQDHQNFLIAIDRASETGELETAIRVASALGQFWETRGHVRLGRSKFEPLWQKTRESKLPAKIGASALTALGGLAVTASDFATGREYHEQSLALYRELNDLRGQAQALSDLGRAAFEQGDYAAARPFTSEGLDLWRELGDEYGAAGSLNTLGLVACEQGDYTTAVACYHESLDLRRAIGDRRGVATQLNNLGVVYRRQGDYAGAKSAFSEAVEMQRELGNRRSVSGGLSNLGLVAEHELDYESARALQEESLTIRREIGDEWGIARSLTILGIVSRHEGDATKALGFLEESLAICRRVGNRLGISQGLCQIGDLLAAGADPESARPFLTESISIMQELNNKQGMTDLLQAYSRFALALGNAPASAQLFYVASELRKSIGAKLPPFEQSELADQLTQLKVVLTAAELSWAKEAQLSTDQAFQLASSL